MLTRLRELPDLTLVSALEVAVSTLRDQLAAANGRADRPEAGREAERERADDLAGRLANARAELAAAQGQAEAATARVSSPGEFSPDRATENPTSRYAGGTPSAG
jgi:hypothetical protein